MEDIAVVGFSFKLPQDVNDVSSFWTVLQERRNLMTDWPESRINADGFRPNKQNKLHGRGGHFINEDPGAFDAPFFSITAKEAASMDPMQRWTLETSYHAFENAGIPVEKIKGSRTAVFGASMTDDYSRMLAQDPENAPRAASTGTFASILPNRVSWYFDLRGPSIHVDTACSSSLLAVDLACQSIRTGEASMALVNGSNLILGPAGLLLLSNLNFLSPDSKCYSFDHKANGYSRGEGIISLVLKPLSSAIEDGDMIRAVIRSTGSNQDGRTPGLTQPSSEAQEELIRQVYKKANLSFVSTRYVEAHGTGTPVGDPIEMKAIGKVFRRHRSAKEPLYVGSVKANIGHLEGSSGLAGVIKAIMILENGIIPPNALFEKINPDIDAEFYHTEVPTRSIAWPSQGLRRVSVNSFGFGGSNTHVILDDALHYLKDRELTANHCTIPSHDVATNSTNGIPQVNGTSRVSGNLHDPILVHKNGIILTNGHSLNNSATFTNGISVTNGTHPTNGLDTTSPIKGTSTRSTWTNGISHSENTLKLLIWSAADEKAIKRLTHAHDSFYNDHISGNPVKLGRLAYTLAARRSRMLWRTFAVVSTCGSDTRVKGLQPVKPVRTSTEAGLAFVFTGQGAQYVDMGLGLLHYPIFEKTLQRVDEVFSSLGCEWSIFDELRSKNNMDLPEYSQPLSTALQIALVELLKSLSVVPDAVVGHSSGEIAAAYTIGALSLPAACRVSYLRGQLAGKLRRAMIDSSSPGAMMSVNLPEDQVQGYLDAMDTAHLTSSVSVACVNSPLNCTLSGPESAIDAIKRRLDEEGVFAQKLKTGVAYHSKTYMSSIADKYLLSMKLASSLETNTSDKTRRLTTTSSSSSIPMVSSVTGRTVRPEVLATSRYWVDNLVSPVRFADAVQTLTQKTLTLKVGMTNITDLVEIGPHPALRRPVQDTVGQAGNRRKEIRYGSVLHRAKPAVESTLELLGQLFCHGHAVDIPGANVQYACESDDGTVNAGPPPPPFLVDCPRYPFDHSNTYWAESRLSRDFRLRGGVVGETLGSRFSDWNPLEPRWRNFLSIETSPWIGDHVVSDTVIYPAAGMLIMAMEAAQQMCPPNRQISGYYIKEAIFVSPILVKETWDERTETMLHLRPLQKSHEKESSWSEIKIFSRPGDQWTECFRATIQIQYVEESTQVDAGLEKRLADKKVFSKYTEAEGSCTRRIDSQVFYKDSADHGIKYGDWFQLLEDIRWDGGSNAIARVNVSAPRYQTTSLVHPAILDAAFHVLRVSGTRGLTVSSFTNVPTRLLDAWFAPRGWQHHDTCFIRYLAATSSEPGREIKDGTICALADDGSALCTMGKLVTTQVSRDDEGSQVAKKLLYGVEWKPQLSLLDPQQLLHACGGDILDWDESTMILHHQKLRSVLDKVVFQTLRQLTEAERKKAPTALRRQVAWMEYHAKKLSASGKHSNGAEDMDEETLEALLQEIEVMHPPWRLFTAVVRNLRPILVGDTDPLEVIFDSDLAEIFYADMFETICDERLRRFLDLASHENPKLRILEVGAGTGGMTSHVLSTLLDLEQQNGGLRFAEYTYTDVSPTFFEKASDRWPDVVQSGRMFFRTFDLERAPNNQGLQPGSYDIVVAGSVLHATEDIATTLRNVRATLKPGGRLVVLEAVAPENVMTNFVFGLAPGWWRCREDWRALSPAVVEGQWDACLRAGGFSGNDLCLRDYRDESCHVFSIMVTTAEGSSLSPPVAKSKPAVFLVVDDQSQYQAEFSGLLRASLDPSGDREVKVLSLGQFQDSEFTPDDIVIFLLELDRPFLAEISEQGFQNLQSLVKRTRNWLWVTSTGIEDAQYAEYSIMQGFLRSMRSEAIDKHIVTLTIESQGENSSTTAQHIAKVFGAAFQSSTSSLSPHAPSQELEYVVRNGTILTGRAVEELSLNETMSSLLHPQLRHKSWQSGPALELRIGTPGILDTLHFEQDRNKHQAPLLPQEVEIETKAWGLNFRDVFVALGRLDDVGLGGDCAGVVTRVGPDCDEAIQPGDRVCMISMGCMRTFARSHQSTVVKIPDNLSFEAAASVIGPGITAYYSLLEVARLRSGERVLIHSAAGSTGQMAIWIAKLKGAEIFATVGFDDKKQFLMEHFGIPENHIFYSRNISFAQGIMRVTQGRGVNVVLNSLSGDGLRASWECVAPYGRFIEIGKTDIVANSSLPMAGFAKNVSFSAVDLHHIIQSDTELTSSLLQGIVNFLVGGDVRHPTPLHVYPVSEVEQAFRYMQSGKNTGRIVISVNPSDVVPQRGLERPSWTFDANSSYVIAGGLGGLGRAIMKWMVGRGAKHLIALSRSGPKSKAALEVVSELRQRGVNLFTPKCDASSNPSLAAVLEECAQKMPPIKGCINAAMVLQDAVFENMTHAQWELTVRSKAQSSWNLHSLLPHSLDFFVLLSSLAGILGTIGQSNYAGGCSLQDALARYRVARGQKAVSLDIGWMRNIGIIAETESYQRNRKTANDMQQIDDTELLALLSLYCDPEKPLLSVDKSQVLIGLHTPADFIARGEAVPSILERPLFAPFSHVVGQTGTASATTANASQVDKAAALFRQAGDTGEQIQIVIRALAMKLARAMSISPDDVELNKPLSSYGVDSLMAVELRNWIGRDFQANVAVFDIMGGVPIAAIGDLVVNKSTCGFGRNKQSVVTNGH